MIGPFAVCLKTGGTAITRVKLVNFCKINYMICFVWEKDLVLSLFGFDPLIDHLINNFQVVVVVVSCCCCKCVFVCVILFQFDYLQ